MVAVVARVARHEGRVEVGILPGGRAAVGRDVLRAASDVLRPAGIPLAPLKGVYLQACAYACPEDRPITDVDVLADRPPTVSFARPGRDTSASSIEEVFVEAAADDDYGVKDLELVYSVNGGAEKTVKLFAGNKRLGGSMTKAIDFFIDLRIFLNVRI